MPRSAPKACRTPGCRNTCTKGTLCSTCEPIHRNAYEQQRPNANQRGYSSKWQSYSQRFLAANPFCCDPDKRHPDRLVASAHTDHITPPRTALVGLPLNVNPKPVEYHKLWWDPKNHQPLCHSCHSFKTATRDSGFANRNLPRG
jgi:5-methylcytosine-specific restriction protein A